MGALDDGDVEFGRVGRNGTDIPSVAAVDAAVLRIVRSQWGGWPAADRDDLRQTVMAKYFRKFGRDRLPEDADGVPNIPFGWLQRVARNAAIDLHRHREARPDVPADFHAPDEGLERVAARLQNPVGLSTAVASKLDLQGVLRPAMQALAAEHPGDLRLIVWRYIEDHDIDTIAATLGKSTDTTRKAVQRAVAKLKQFVMSPVVLDEGNDGPSELFPDEV